MKPETCGECERFFDDGEHSFCTPIKDKYGWEPVYADQKPSVNCPYEEIGSLNKDKAGNYFNLLYA